MNQPRSAQILFPAVLFALFLGACSDGSGLPSTGGGGTGQATSITVIPAAVTVPCNRVTQLAATDSNGTDVTTTVTWTSTDNTNAPVSATGLVTPPPGCTGSATITAISGALSNTSTVTLTAATTFTLGGLSDPLVPQQWHLNNAGQNGYSDTNGTAGEDINVDTVYSNTGIDGTGVIVAVVDTGLEIAHEDLTANVVAGGSWDFVNSDNDPTNPNSFGDHGTAVAGLIASTRNTVGGMGVASGASLKGFNFLVSSQSISDYVGSLGGSSNNPDSHDVWIFNQSYGTSTSRALGVSTALVNQLIYGSTTLRNGKGALYVKAAGNGFDDNGGEGDCTDANALGISCENANFDPDNTEPYNIVVGALNANGERSSYSTTGSTLWVSAPGGEFGANAAVLATCNGGACPPEVYEPAMVTTDQSTCNSGIAQTSDLTGVISDFNGGTGAPNVDNAACNYTNTMNGTSSATPVTAGAIALMLEANPSLTWRDVKHILAATATKDTTLSPDGSVMSKADVNVVLGNGGTYTAEPTWTTNTAGYRYHNWYGFGRVNADAAVTAAMAYPYGQLGTFTNTGWISSGAILATIPNDSSVGGSSQLGVANNLTIEAVQIRVTVSHAYTGDLGIELRSPAGTRSVLKNIRDGFDSSNFNNFQLESNAFYGEASGGTWALKVVDGNGAVGHTGNGRLSSWQIRVFGH